MSQFSKGLIVKYRDFIGTVRFICNEYITVCVATHNDRSRDVCILVPCNEWKNIHLTEELEK